MNGSGSRLRPLRRTWPKQVDDVVCDVGQGRWVGETGVGYVPGRRPCRSRWDPCRTQEAVLLETRDGGLTFRPLPWRCTWRTRHLAAWADWSPERLDAVRLEDGRLVIEWEDPWLVWELGSGWRATWDPRRRAWRIEWRDVPLGSPLSDYVGAYACLALQLVLMGLPLLSALLAWAL